MFKNKRWFLKCMQKFIKYLHKTFITRNAIISRRNEIYFRPNRVKNFKLVFFQLSEINPPNSVTYGPSRSGCRLLRFLLSLTHTEKKINSDQGIVLCQIPYMAMERSSHHKLAPLPLASLTTNIFLISRNCQKNFLQIFPMS